MTFQITDQDGKVLGEPALAEDFAIDAARRFTTASGKPVWVQRFLTNAAGEDVPCGPAVQIGAEADETP
jgi:hypothetical protein